MCLFVVRAQVRPPPALPHRQGPGLALRNVQEAQQDLLRGAGAVGEVHLVVAHAVLREAARLQGESQGVGVGG